MLKTENYSKAYVEVLEVLSKMSKDDVDKIPKKFMDLLEKDKDTGYEFKMEDGVPLEQVNLLKESRAILAYILINYWADEKQKERIMQKLKTDIYLEEEKKKEKYSVNVFEQKNKNIKIEKNEMEEINLNNLSLEPQKQNPFVKLWAKIKFIFNGFMKK